MSSQSKMRSYKLSCLSPEDDRTHKHPVLILEFEKHEANIEYKHSGGAVMAANVTFPKFY